MSEQMPDTLPVHDVAGGNAVAARRRFEGDWFLSLWFNLGITSMAFAVILAGVSSRAPWQFVAGQMTLLAGVYVALFMLSSERLLNPVQAGVLLFYWWFGVGPLVLSSHAALLGNAVSARAIQQNGQSVVLLVAAGLPLYALAGRAALDRLSAAGIKARFLEPAGDLYRPSTLVLYWVVGGGALLAVRMFDILGLPGITTLNYLGGTRTDFWGAGVINAVAVLSSFGVAGMVTHLAFRKWQTPWWLFGLIVLVMGEAVFRALTSGWKGAFFVFFAMLLSAWTTAARRPPWAFVLFILFSYIAVVEPFVMAARHRAEVTRAQSVTDRERVFVEHLRGGGLSVSSDWREWRVRSPFRDIYAMAAETTRRASCCSGPWRGDTLVWGLQANIPRAIFPGKPEMSVGNFFARAIGSPIGLSGVDNFINNVPVSIPFEMVGNFGWVAGLLTFPLLGAAWAFWCGWLLSPARISTHPLAPFFVVSTLNFERDLGSFLNLHRDMLFALAAAYAIWLIRKGRL
jgi:hypothetical protein